MTDMKRKSTYIVETLNKESGSHWNYFEEAISAQGAVNIVRMYMSSTEEVIGVYKQVKNWD